MCVHVSTTSISVSREEKWPCATCHMVGKDSSSILVPSGEFQAGEWVGAEDRMESEAGWRHAD